MKRSVKENILTTEKQSRAECTILLTYPIYVILFLNMNEQINIGENICDFFFCVQPRLWGRAREKGKKAIVLINLLKCHLAKCK